MTLTLKRDQLLILFEAWWIGFIVLSNAGFEQYYLLPVVGFISLAFLPGILTIGALKLSPLSVWTYLPTALGLSLLELIGVGLISNTLLPFFGETRPLDKDPILALLTLLVVTLATIYWFRLKEEVLTINLFKTWNIRDSMVAFAPLMFVALSINGASYLNAGDTGTTTLLMLIGAALYSGALIYYSNRLKGDVTLTALFFIGLALLLMTSLRGYFIVGHDIQNEFRVFEFARQMGFWTIDTYRDAYNACMSITILPTIFANLLHLPAPYVFKALFQVLFAFVPPMVFLIVRRYISTRMALIAALYFVAFPTFFTDMPFLNRQEIAFIFLALMFLIGFDERLAYRTRQLLFVVFGAGMILSHYSTTYTIIALLGLLIVARPIFRLVSKFLPKQLQNTTVAALAKEVKTARPQVTLWMVVVLAGLSFFWSSVLTDTSSNSLYRVITKTVAAMQSAYVEDTRSSDVLYSLFSWEKPDPQVLFGEYKAAALERVSEEPDKYYPSATFEKYDIPLAKQELLPLTSLGSALTMFGINVPTFNFTFRQLSAKFLQLFMVVGLIAALYRKKWFVHIPPPDFILMGAGSVFVLCLIIVLPVLSVEYGLLRAFQQSLMLLAPFIVVGSMATFFFVSKVRQEFIAGSLVLVFLLSSTGVFTQLLGGYDAQLHLNNSGPYYDLYYVHESEEAAIDWLAGEVARNVAKGIEITIQSDHYGVQAAPALKGAYIVSDIYPPLIRRDAYVVLSVKNVTKNQAAVSYNQTAINYYYPMRFLEDIKSLVYDQDGVRIYR